MSCSALTSSTFQRSISSQNSFEFSVERATPATTLRSAPIGALACPAALQNRAKLAAALSFYAPDFPDSSLVDPMLWDAVEALALLPSVAPVAAIDPDAALLRAIASWRATDASVKAYEASHDVEDHDDDEFDVICGTEGKAVNEVAAIRATTPAGMREKAAVLRHYLHFHHENEIAEGCTSDDISLALSLCADLLGEVGA